MVVGLRLQDPLFTKDVPTISLEDSPPRFVRGSATCPYFFFLCEARSKLGTCMQSKIMKSLSQIK